MKILPIASENEWNLFFESIGSPSFHQSWEWGVLQEQLGYKIMRLGLYNDENALEMIALVVKIRSKRGSFLFVPHGPLFRIETDKLSQTIPDGKIEPYKSQLQFFRDYLIEQAKKEGFWFIRMASILNRTTMHAQLFKSLGFRTAPTYMHAETMWVVDITQSEDQILSAMRKNTRYLIRRAIREHISVTKHSSLDALEDFWELYQHTSYREKFTPYSKSYLQKEFESFHKNNNAIFFIGGFNKNIKDTIPANFAKEGTSRKIAGSLIVFTKSSGFYHQGASIHTPYPAAYLLQWESMKETKKRGCTYYSFHGIHDPGRTPKSWVGLSLFKHGFGGFPVEYLYTQDYIISPFYYFSFIIDKWLTFRRGV